MVGSLLLPVLLLQAKVGEEPNLVVASGTATRTVPADRAAFTLNAVATNADLEGAKAEARRLLARALVAAHKVVADPKAYGEEGIAVEPRYETGGSGVGGVAFEQRVKEYDVAVSTQVSGVELDRVETMQKTVQVEGTTVTLSGYGLKDLAAARRAVLHDAFLDARTKAAEVADAAGLRLGDVYLIETNVSPNFYALPEEGTGRSTGNVTLGAKLSPRLQATAGLTVRFRLVK